MPRAAREFNKDSDMPPHERLGLGEPVGVLQQFGEVVEVRRDSGMVRPQAVFADGQRAPAKRLGVGGELLF